MRCFICILFLLVASRLTAANAIDSLTTDRDVEAFANKQIEKAWKINHFDAQVLATAAIYNHVACDSVAKRWSGKNWQKTDFNGDGKTDLLVIMYFDKRDFNTYVFVDNGQSGFKVHNLKRDHFANCELAHIITVDSRPALLYTYVKREPTRQIFDYRQHLQTDTLIYQFDGFAEYNAKPPLLAVNSVYIKTYGAWMETPAFELTLKRNGQALYESHEFKAKKGVQTGKITDQQFKKLVDLMSYININKLQDHYAVNWTDDQTVILTITFADGSVKSIEDYGQKGSFGLSHLYGLLFALRSNEQGND